MPMGGLCVLKSVYIASVASTDTSQQWKEALQLSEDKSSNIFRGFSEEENISDGKISESTEMKQNI